MITTLAGNKVTTTFLEDVKRAVREGVLLGIKWVIVVVLVLFGVAWFLGDYQVVRMRALNGQIAWERQQNASRQSQQPNPGALQPGR